MKVLLQRVISASVEIDKVTFASINKGVLLFIGFTKSDTSKMIAPLVSKILKLRIFENEQRKLDKSILDISCEILVVSQFTLYANLSKGNRPDFNLCAPYDNGKELFDQFVEEFSKYPIALKTGIYGADMNISLINDGPLTLILES